MARGNGFGIRKYFAQLLIGMAIVFAVTGASCDSDTFATFRSEAITGVGDGVKSIMNGILDGIIAAVSDAGDASAS